MDVVEKTVNDDQLVARGVCGTERFGVVLDQPAEGLHTDVGKEKAQRVGCAEPQCRDECRKRII